MTDVTPPPAPSTTPLWEDFIDIFTSPSAVFERRKGDPQFFAAMMILTAIFAVVTFAAWDLMEPVRHADAMRQIEKVLHNNPNITGDQADQLRARAATGGTIGRYLGGLIIPVSILVVGLYTFLGAKIVGARTTMGQAYMVTTYAFTPKLIGLLIGVVLAVALPDAMLNGQGRLTLGPALLLDPDTTRQSVIVALARLDLPTLWVTALIALGIKRTGEVSTGKAAIAGAVVWLLGGIILVGLVFVGELAQGVH